MTVSFNSYNIILTPLTSSLYKEGYHHPRTSTLSSNIDLSRRRKPCWEHWLAWRSSYGTHHCRSLPELPSCCRSCTTYLRCLRACSGPLGIRRKSWPALLSTAPRSPSRRPGSGTLTWVSIRTVMRWFFSFIKSMCNSSCFIDLFITVYQWIPL